MSIAVCDDIPESAETVIIEIDGTQYMHDPRVVFYENTVENPNMYGARRTSSLVDGQEMRCGNAKRNYKNEKGCKVSGLGACFDSVTEWRSKALTLETLSMFHELTSMDEVPQYVYAVSDLLLAENGDTTSLLAASPCQTDVVSRWVVTGENYTACLEGDTTSNTEMYEALANLISAARATDKNEFMVDTLPTTDICTSTSASAGTTIYVGGECFKHSHPKALNVYVFTTWADLHPGKSYHITKWADERDTFILPFPHTSELRQHTLNDFESNIVNERKFQYVGRLGDSVSFSKLPGALRTDAIASYFGALDTEPRDAVVVCGSPREVSNAPQTELDDKYHFTTLHNGPLREWNQQRKALFMEVALNAEDQLRQRVAFALNQIFPISETDLADINQETEPWLQYYDIFVEHAFGNFRDVLREVTYSPLMGRMLSYAGSMSAQHAWKAYKANVYPDENFAREIMQLFTIGLTKLHPDGTPVLDDEGDVVLTYTNEDIKTGARLATGLDRPQIRGNHENMWNWEEYIDPMVIRPERRDQFPKMALGGGHIGDGYPLCGDMPPRMFLRKGAVYRALGSSSVSESHYQVSWVMDDFTERLTLDSNSALYAELCASDDNSCTYPGYVELNESLDCYGVECNLTTVNVLKVGNVHYEYVPPPCVFEAFLSDAVVVQRYKAVGKCADKKTAVARSACCDGPYQDWAFSICDYPDQLITFTDNEQRCTGDSLQACSFFYGLTGPSSTRQQGYDAEGRYCRASHQQFYWTENPCATHAIVGRDGHVRVAHEFKMDHSDVDSGFEANAYTVLPPVAKETTRNIFRVDWEGGRFPAPATCALSSCIVYNGECMCEVIVLETAVFDSDMQPSDLAARVALLHVGSVAHDIYDADTYAAGVTTWTEGELTVTLRAKTGFPITDVDTIVEFTDEYGRIRRFKNVRKTVHIDVEGDNYSFKNAPHFIEISEADGGEGTHLYQVRHEIEAWLDQVREFSLSLSLSLSLSPSKKQKHKRHPEQCMPSC